MAALLRGDLPRFTPAHAAVNRATITLHGGLAMDGDLYGANTARTQPSFLCLNMS